LQLNELEPTVLQTALSTNGVGLSVGPFSVHLRNSAPGFAETLNSLYSGSPVELEPQRHFNDFIVSMARPKVIRRIFRPQVVFETDNATPFIPFPLDHAFPHFEWGLNWLIATQAHQYLMFHSAVLERSGKALILPAIPGSGKSTLCAALMLRGWRLLSDEFGLLRPETGLMEPLPRPIPLKNESIDIIKGYSDEVFVGPTFPKTRKGDVAHVRPSDNSLRHADIPAQPAWVVFPQYKSGSSELLHPFAKGRAFLKLSGNSFNYRLQGARGFEAVADVIDSCSTWYLEFSDLDKAAALLEEMAENDSVSPPGSASA
jgi:HprK-related kinase A